MINFGSGPAKLPEEVLKEAADAVLEYNGSGMSILEIPHRGKMFDDILEESKMLINELCELDNEYEALWLQGGRLQFAMIPMNFLGENETAGYIDSGHWADEAAEYAKHYGNVNVLASSKKDNYNHLPTFPTNIPAHLSYLYFTTNNTIYGTQWNEIPPKESLRTKCNVPVIADMSSDILSKKMEYKNCSLFYAVAQKNIGPAGVTLVVIKKDFLKQIKRKLPPILDYATQVKHNSILNTPPVFAIYTSLLTLRWIKRKTIESIEKESIIKAAMLYDEIERNNLFEATVKIKEHRSRMNVCFLAKNMEIEKKFSDVCTRNNITGITGHRSTGGFRASLYNAISISDVEKLVALMQEFES